MNNISRCKQPALLLNGDVISIAAINHNGMSRAADPHINHARFMIGETHNAIMIAFDNHARMVAAPSGDWQGIF